MNMNNAERNELRDLLSVACTLLMVEAKDHHQNHQIEKEKRRAIAKTLEAFCNKASRTMETVS